LDINTTILPIEFGLRSSKRAKQNISWWRVER
jgi:hypothetical protein